MVERPDTFLKLSKLSPEFLTRIVVQPGLSPVHVCYPQSADMVQADAGLESGQVQVVERHEVSKFYRNPFW